MKRGEIYYANLDPVVGSEQGGVRPTVILQNDIGNYYSPTVIVATITSRQKCPLPTHVHIGEVIGLTAKSYIQLEQVKTIDKSRVLEYVGHLNDTQLAKMNEALKISVSL
ncbi:MAG: type II toxin-antitoxin system PemK/MazF family toxin [Clostridia bacterium]